ncbi:MAG: hypothetical protein Q9N68_02790, partial [Gammaproteobacteria bacterium]|nr:hypothetical protein [Gammaproteobacteria bacterium]
PEKGDLIYRSGADIACIRLEKFLFKHGVCGLYQQPFFECLEQTILLQKAGISTPKTVYSLRADRRLLTRHIEYLGGFPLVIKIPGSEGGMGLIQVDSYPALTSLLDHLGGSPLLMEYIEHACSYRLVVLGDEVIATKTLYPAAADFRSNSHGGQSDYRLEVPTAAKEIALHAAQILQLEFGGVDILARPDGTLVFAELNFPCYFADQQNEGGVDISGKILDYLRAKSRIEKTT